MYKRSLINCEKNYGIIYVYGNTDDKELQTETIKEPSEKELQEWVERGVRFVLSSKDKASEDEVEKQRRLFRRWGKQNLTKHIKPQKGYVRIDSEGYGFMNITEIAKKYSLSTNLPVLFWSGFDDLIMILGVAAYGEIQTIHSVVDEEDEQPFVYKKGNSDTFRKLIPVKNEEAFAKLMLERNVFNAQDLGKH